MALPVKAHAREAATVAAELEVDLKIGLIGEQVRLRLDQYGPNELDTAAPTPAWKRLLAQFKDALVLLLVAAAAVSLIAWVIERETELPYESLAILSILVLNAVLGLVQETRAEHALAALRAMSAPAATVIRAGARVRIPARELVPGDVLAVEEGDTIAADARVVEAVELRTMEASLTGESTPVVKDARPAAEGAALGDRVSMLFAGTHAIHGHGRAVVIATGMRTELGRIAGMLQSARAPETPLQRQLNRTGKQLGIAVIGIAAVVVATLLILEGAPDVTTVVHVLMFGVALAVAAAPEGLAAVVTVVLALGVQRMAARGAIVRKLPAVETLGSATVIASDKTGTLTRNEMTVRSLVTASGRAEVTGAGYAPLGEIRGSDGVGLSKPAEDEAMALLRAAALANNAVLVEQDGAWSVQGDPTEGALLVAARKAGIIHEAVQSLYPRVGEAPFSSERKLMSTVHSDGSGLAMFAKGAPATVLERCTREYVGSTIEPLTQERRAEILRASDAMADEALRALGAAFRPLEEEEGDEGDELERDLVFLGLVGMTDPPRPEARQAVERAKGAGIRPVLITGDHPGTAAAIAREVGIAAGGQIMVGPQIEAMSEDDLAAAARVTEVYARVNPAHKLRIVSALQRNGEVVAMTGDGVNDAPALKSADIGVAMGITGTDVSKQAADLVLTDDNFATIVAAVDEGRAVFDNIRKFLRYLLSSNVGEVLTIFFAVVLSKPMGLGEEGVVVLPLIATQILWINLVTDGPPALALGIDPPAADLMSRPPRPKSEGVITRRMWANISLVGAAMATGTLLAFDASLPGGLIEGPGGMEYGRTMAFTTLMLSQLFNAFNSRSDHESAFQGLFANRWLWGAVALSLGLHMLAIYTPGLQRAFGTVALTGADWVRCLVAASGVLWIAELVKLGTRKALVS
jgi:Ca2+-transporting ATPase